MKNLAVLNVIAGILIAVAILLPFIYWPYFAGDAVIHFIYGENAAKGVFFAFNPGEPSSGMTSPAYMIFLMLIYKSFDPQLVPLLVKITGYSFWYISLFLTFKAAQKIFYDFKVSLAVLLMVALMPGSVLNAVKGMENVIFMALTLSWFYFVLTWRWFDRRCSIRKELFLGGILGCGIWLRPEALPFVAIAVASKFLATLILQPSRLRDELLRGVIPIAFVFSFLIVVMLWHLLETGMPLFGAASARANLSSIGGFDLGIVTLQTRFTERLFYYGPLTLFFIVGFILVSRNLKLCSEKSAKLAPLLFSGMLFLGFFILYSTVFSDIHLARYTLFLWPYFSLVVAYGVLESYKWASTHYAGYVNIYNGFVLVSFFMLAGIFVVETYMRLKMPQGHRFDEVASAPEMRVKYTDDFLKENGFISNTRITIGAVEVQVRYWLDERVTVRSLDGLVDTCMSRFFRDNRYDYAGYIKARHIDLLVEFPNHSKDAAMWSPAELNGLKKGDSIDYNGLKFTRMPTGYIRVHHVGTEGADDAYRACL